MINIEEQITLYKKKARIDLIIIIVLSCLLVTSILLFTLLSNYKIQIVMSVVGSIVSSILAILITYFVLSRFLVNKAQYLFLNRIIDCEIEEAVIETIEYQGLKTIVKNVILKQYSINSKIFSSLCEEHDYAIGDIILIKGNYILGKKNEQK